MGLASRIFMLMLIINCVLFAFTEVIGRDSDGNYLNGNLNYSEKIGDEGDMFGSGIIQKPQLTTTGNTTGYTAIALNQNASSDSSIVPDIDSTVEPNSNYQFSTIAFGWTMISKGVGMLLKFIAMPILIFGTEWGFAPAVSFLLQLIIGIPLTISFVLSLGFMIFGRSTW